MQDAGMLEQKLVLLEAAILELHAPGREGDISTEAAMDLVKEIQQLASNVNLSREINLQEELRKVEMHLIRSALKKTYGHQTHAAKLLGIKLTTLNNKLKRFGICARNINKIIDPDTA